MKIRKSLYQVITAIFIGTIFIPLSSASTSGNFTNNGAGALTVGPGYTNVLVMDVDIPDGVNNSGTEDIPMKAGSGTALGGDTLNAITALSSVNGVGYKDNGTAGFQGTEPVVRDLDADAYYTTGPDTLVDADGSATSGAGTTGLSAGASLRPMGNDVAHGSLAVCTDSLTTPVTAVRIDVDGDCTNNSSNDGTYVLGTSATAAGTEVDGTWSYEDTNSDLNYDDGEDIFIESVPGASTYSTGTDIDVYGTGGLFGGDMLTNFGADCDGGGAGTLDCKFTGSAPIDATESIFVDETNAGILDIAVDQLNAITVANAGTAIDTTDIAAVHIWMDGGDTLFDCGPPTNSCGAVDDIPLSPYPVGASSTGAFRWAVSGLTQVIGIGGEQIFIAVDIAGSPTDSATIQMEIDQLSDGGATPGAFDAGERGVFVQSANDGPTDGPVTNGGIQTIDSQPPTGSASVGTATLYDGDLTQEVTINYSENMDTSGANDPTINFGATAGVISSNLDGSWTGPATWYETFNITDLNENTPGVTVSSSGAQDLYGNTEGAPVVTTFNVDTQNPIVTGTNLIADESACTGTSGECIIGNNLTFSWDNTGIGPGDSNTDIASITADLTNFGDGAAQPLTDSGGGLYTYVLGIPVGTDDGTYNFVVTVTDNAGNTTIQGSTDTAPVDNEAPIFGTSGLAIVGDGGVIGVAAFNGGATPPDQVIVNATLINPDTDTITWDPTPINGGPIAPNNTPVFVVAGGTDNPLQQFNVTAVDDAGNSTTTDTFTIDGLRISVDNQIPAFATSTVTISTDAAPLGVAAVNDGITPDQVTVNTTVALGDTDTITWDATPINGGPVVANNTPQPVLVGGSIIDTGAQAFNITATDNGGNTISSDTNTVGASTISVDNDVPTILTPGFLTITSDANGNGVAETGDTVTYNDAVPTTGDTDTMQVNLNTLTGTPAATNIGSPYAVIVGTLSGPVQFTETVTDDAGNIVTGNTAPLNVDNRPRLTGTGVSLSQTGINAYSVDTISFNATSGWPPNGIFEVVFPAQIDPSNLNGKTALNLVGVDSVLNITVAGQTVTVTRDGLGTPVGAGGAVSFDLSSTLNGPTAGATGTFSFETQDNTATTIDVDTAVPGVTLTTTSTTPAATGGGGAGGSLYPIPVSTSVDEVPAMEAGATPFPDVDGHWAEPFIGSAYDGGYVEGFGDGNFAPDIPTTRAEVSKLIALWKGVPEDYVCNPEAFPDVDCGEYYGIYVTYLNEIGVVEGYEDGTFHPEAPVSRAEAVKMLIFVKLLQDTDISDVLNPFSDVSIEDWFYNVVMVSYKLGIVEGYGDGTFMPDNDITRAEFTKVFVETLLNN